MNNIIDKVLTSNNIVLLCHNNPDGDAIGSTLAMYHTLKKLDKEVDIEKSACTLCLPRIYPRRTMRSSVWTTAPRTKADSFYGLSPKNTRISQLSPRKTAASPPPGTRGCPPPGEIISGLWTRTM